MPIAPDVPRAGRRAVAENLLKERIRSFGFRTWSDEGGARRRSQGCAGLRRRAARPTIKRLSMRLPKPRASSSPSTRSTSWTVKCVDRTTGEEIYFNTRLPKGDGQLRERGGGAEGDRHEDRRTNSRATSSCSTCTSNGQRDSARRRGLARRRPRTDAAAGASCSALPAVMSARPRATATGHASGTCASPGSVSSADLVAAGILDADQRASSATSCFVLGASDRRAR